MKVRVCVCVFNRVHCCAVNADAEVTNHNNAEQVHFGIAPVMSLFQTPDCTIPSYRCYRKVWYNSTVI